MCGAGCTTSLGQEQCHAKEVGGLHINITITKLTVRVDCIGHEYHHYRGPLSLKSLSILFVTQIDSLVDVPEELCDLNPQVKLVEWKGKMRSKFILDTRRGTCE